MVSIFRGDKIDGNVESTGCIIIYLGRKDYTRRLI